MSRFGGQKALKEGKKESRIRLDKTIGHTNSSQDTCRKFKQPNNDLFTFA